MNFQKTILNFSNAGLIFQAINYKLLYDLDINMLKHLCKFHKNPLCSFSETVHTNLFYKIDFSKIFSTFFNKIEK